HCRAWRVPQRRRDDARSRARAEGARRAAAAGARSSAVRPADGDRAAGGRRAELRGNRVLARRGGGNRQVAPGARAPGAAPRAAGSEVGMKALPCAATRRRLQAYHDRELAITEQIAVGAHLEWCDRCAATLTDLRGLRHALQALAPGRPAAAETDADVF